MMATATLAHFCNYHCIMKAMLFSRVRCDDAGQVVTTQAELVYLFVNLCVRQEKLMHAKLTIVTQYHANIGESYPNSLIALQVR